MDKDLAKAETASPTAGGEQAIKEKLDENVPASVATAPETESTTTTEKPSEVQPDQAKAAVGVEGYQKMLDDAFAEAERKKAESGKQEPAAPETETATEVTPPEEATERVEGDAAPESTEEEHKLPERIRLAGLKDGHLVAAANTIAREENIPFAEAWDRVAPKKTESVQSGTREPAATEKTEAATDLRSRADIEAEITATKAEKKQAATDLDTGKMYDADEKIEALRHELDLVEHAEYNAEETRKATEQTKFTSEVSTAKAKAIASWPEAGDDNSEFSKRMIELADQLEKDPDPGLRSIVFDADAPFVIARMVAKEQGILPKHLRRGEGASAPSNGTKPSTSTAATKPAPVNQRAVGRPAQPAASPASGAARTTQEGSKADALGLDKIRSVTDYEEAVAKARKLAAA